MVKDEVLQTLKEFLGKMAIDVSELSVTDAGGHTLFTIKTKDSGALIGSGGETLHALNHIIKKIFEGKDEGEEAFRFVIDVNGYHLKHINSLEHQARMLAERARMFKHDVDMSPMSAYDRLIVHASLQGLPDIKTESQGEGKVRHIVIKYTGADAVAEPAQAESPL